MRPWFRSRLKDLWAEAEAGRLTSEQCYARQQEWIGDYAEIWADALLLPGENDLKHSLCAELGKLEDCANLTEIERRCRSAMLKMKEEWNVGFREDDAEFTVKYYDKSPHYPYELMWWHTLMEDQSPLAYVAALHLALQNGFKHSLDFGVRGGFGRIALLQARLHDRVGRHQLNPPRFLAQAPEGTRHSGDLYGLENKRVARGKYDFITAMDVFEHIAEPEKAARACGGAPCAQEAFSSAVLMSSPTKTVPLT